MRRFWVVASGAERSCALGAMKVTRYFETIRQRPDRALIQGAWIQRAIDSPIRQVIQKDGRIRRWCQVPEGTIAISALSCYLTARPFTTHSLTEILCHEG